MPPRLVEIVETAMDKLPFIDYVLVYKTDDTTRHSARQLFEAEMVKDGLIVVRSEHEHVTFVKVYCPFERLALQAERVRLEMPLKDCAIPEPATSRWRRLVKTMTTDDEVDFVSAPYERDKPHLFEGAHDHETFFRTATRSFLVYNMLINLNIDEQLRKNEVELSVHSGAESELKKRGLLYLIMRGAYSDSFVLHDASVTCRYMKSLKQRDNDKYNRKLSSINVSLIDRDARTELDETWTKVHKFQPLWKIRNYFGEKIAFYFAWQGTFITVLWIPQVFMSFMLSPICRSIVGIYLFIKGILVSLDYVAHCSQQNATDIQQYNSTVSSLTSWMECPSEPTTYLEDVLLVLRASFDNIYSAFFAMVMCWWGILFLEIWKRNNYTLAYKWDCDSFESSEPDRPEFVGTDQMKDPITGELSWTYPLWRRVRKFAISGSFVTLFVGIVFVSVTAVILFKLQMRVVFSCTPVNSTYSANVATDMKSRALCYTFTNVLPTVLNALSIMLLGRIYERFARILTSWENHRTQTDFNDALIVKLFVFQFANTYTSLFYIAFIRPEEHGFQTNGLFDWGPGYKDTCERGSCLSLLSLQVFVLMLVKPFPKLFKDFFIPMVKGAFRSLMHRRRRAKVADEEAMSTKDSIKRHSETFAKREYMKAPLTDFTMGEYTEKVIQFGYIIMFASSFSLAPFIALVLNLIDMRIDARRLLWWNRRPVAHIATDIGMWLPILSFVCYMGVISNAFIVAYTSDFCNLLLEQECTSEHRLAIVIVFEHLAIITMIIIRVAIPDRPTAVLVAQRRERYQVTKIMEKGHVPRAKSKDTTRRRNKKKSEKKEEPSAEMKSVDAYENMRNQATSKMSGWSSSELPGSITSKTPSGSVDSESVAPSPSLLLDDSGSLHFSRRWPRRKSIKK